MSRFLPPDHAKGDEGTIGGYAAVHARPAALEGSDGFAYSVEILGDRLGATHEQPFGAYLLFLRWRRVGEEGVEGHLETDFLEFGDSREDALQRLRAWRIERVQDLLNTRIAEERSNADLGRAE
jgi:hypothetical protein